MRAPIGKLLIRLFATWLLATPMFGQTAIVVEFPDPAGFYQNTTFAIDGDVAYVPSVDDDVLWSFSVITGELLDPDGLALPAPSTASDPFLFANDRLAIPGWFPSLGDLRGRRVRSDQPDPGWHHRVPGDDQHPGTER